MRRIGMEYGTGLPERARKSEPVARVALGETFVMQSDTCCQPVVRSAQDVAMCRFRERTETGPVYIEGVRAGDMLRIRIEDIKPIGDASGARHDGVIDYLPIRDGKVLCPGGLWTKVRMMIGVIYVVPDFDDGSDHSAYLKYDLGDNGGNMDYRDICAGHSVCLRARRDGGLLGLGDMHSAQGYGEWLGVGAECAGEVTLTIEREERFASDRPVILKRGSFACLASRWPLCDAINTAARDATAIVAHLTGAPPDEAMRYVLLTGSAMNGQNAHLSRREIISQTDGDVMPVTIGFEVPSDCLGL